MRMADLYVLCDPNGELRYIGVSVDVAARFAAHLRDKANTHKVRWIRQLRSAQQQPQCLVFHSVPEGQLKEAEVYWIAFFRAQGCRLTNSTAGGDGRFGHRDSHETIERRRLHHVGAKRSPEAKAKMSARKKGVVPRNLEKVHAALRGRRQSLGFVAKRADAKRAEHDARAASLAPKIRELQALELTQVQIGNSLGVGRGAVRELLRKLS